MSKDSVKATKLIKDVSKPMYKDKNTEDMSQEDEIESLPGDPSVSFESIRRGRRDA
jgi:hypothetical protein